MGDAFCTSYTIATPVTTWPRRPFPTGGQKLSGKALREAQDAWNFFELVESADAATRVRIAQAGGYTPPNIENRQALWYPLNTTSDLLKYRRGQMLHWETCPAVNWNSQRNLGFPAAPYDVRPQLCA
jgi:hypothetical protein